MGMGMKMNGGMGMMMMMGMRMNGGMGMGMKVESTNIIPGMGMGMNVESTNIAPGMGMGMNVDSSNTVPGMGMGMKVDNANTAGMGMADKAFNRDQESLMEKTNRAPSAQHQMMVVGNNLAPVSSPTTQSMYIFRKGMDGAKYTLATTIT